MERQDVEWIVVTLVELNADVKRVAEALERMAPEPAKVSPAQMRGKGTYNEGSFYAVEHQGPYGMGSQDR